jgi:hypothetical protein
MTQNGIRPATNLVSAALGVVALGALTSGAAFATDIVTFTGVGAEWLPGSVTPPAVTNLNFSNNSGSSLNPQIMWGSPAGSGQSGYEFDQAASASTTFNPPPTSPSMNLGTMKNFNEPITGQAITGVTLQITEDVKINSTDIGNENFLFNFTHDETPNGSFGSSCPYGSGLVGIGSPSTNVNFNGCADRETVSVASGTASFMIGGTAYTIEITGFQQGTSITTDWLTAEQQTNTATLIGDVTAVSNLAPAPRIGSGAAAIALLLGGLGFAGFRSRWLRRTSDHLGVA